MLHLEGRAGEGRQIAHDEAARLVVAVEGRAPRRKHADPLVIAPAEGRQGLLAPEGLPIADVGPSLLAVVHHIRVLARQVRLRGEKLHLAAPS